MAKDLTIGADLRGNELTGKHADWVEWSRDNHHFTTENALDVMQRETGKVFAKVLEHAGVYSRGPEGRSAFLRFLPAIR